MEQQEFILPKIVKDSWDKITLKEFEAILSIEENTELSVTEKEMKLISIYFDIDEDSAWTLNAPQVLGAMAEINPIKHNFKINEDFGKEVLKTNPNSTRKEIKVGDREYEIETEINNITYAQFVQLQTTDKKDKKTTLGMILIPKGKTFGRDYNITEHTEYIYNNISFQMAEDILFFMVKHFLDSINSLVMSLDRKEQKELKKMIEEMLRQTKE